MLVSFLRWTFKTISQMSSKWVECWTFKCTILRKAASGIVNVKFTTIQHPIPRDYKMWFQDKSVEKRYREPRLLWAKRIACRF